MARKARYTPEQIAAALRQAEAGTPVNELARKLGVHENAFLKWRKRYGELGTPEGRRDDRDRVVAAVRRVADLTAGVQRRRPTGRVDRPGILHLRPSRTTSPAVVRITPRFTTPAGEVPKSVSGSSAYHA